MTSDLQRVEQSFEPHFRSFAPVETLEFTKCSGHSRNAPWLVSSEPYPIWKTAYFFIPQRLYYRHNLAQSEVLRQKRTTTQ